MIPLPYKIIALLLAFIGIVGACMLYGHFQYARGVRITTLTYEAAIAKQKNAAAQQLALATTQVAEKEHSLQVAKDNQDIKDAQHTQTVSSLSGKLRDALASSVCDNAGCGGGSNSANGPTGSGANAGTNNATVRGGLFSADFVELLEQLTLKADTINDAYASCRADAFTIRGIEK